MYTEERMKRITDIINEQRSVSVNELCQRLYVSPATMRRDLTLLEKTGKIKRSHGGAVLVEGINNEASIAIRSLESTKEKRKIAELCADFLSSSSTIFMDSSSTAGMVIPYLKPLSSVCVITNGLNNALLLSANTNAKIYVPSGVISTSSNSVLGSDSIAYISSMNADIALISCSGICDEFRITEVSKEQAMLKKMMLHKAKRKVLLCDSNKFSKAFMCDICQTAELDYIITDKVPDKEFVLNCGCKIICG